MRAASQNCPSCGQKIRTHWLRCPACRELVAEAARPAPLADAPARRWIVPVVSGLLVVGAVGAWALTSAGDPVAAVAPTERAEDTADGGGARRTSPTGPPSAKWAAADATRDATAAYRDGDVEAALTGYQRAVSANPDDVTARANLAQVLVRMGRVDEALAHLDYVVSNKPDEWAPRFNRGRAYALLSRWDDARAEYERALVAFPDDHATLFNLGLVIGKSGDHATAAATLERVVALDPEDPSVLVALGREYMALERHDDVRRTFEQYLEMAPAGPDAESVRKVLASAAQR